MARSRKTGAFRSTAVERAKTYEADRWYHVWNRGAGGVTLFGDDADRRVFLGIIERYLGSGSYIDERGRRYGSLCDRIELGTFCLMPTHFHLLLFTSGEPSAMPELLKRLKIAYSHHLRAKRGVTGSAFECRYRADPIRTRGRLVTATAYVNLNHENDADYRFCGHSRLVGSPPPWMNGACRLLDAVGGRAAYEAELRRMTRVRQVDAIRELRDLHARSSRVARNSGLGQA